MIAITLNGEARQLDASLSVEELIQQLGLGHRRVAVLHNGGVIPREAYGATRVGDGDAVEIVHMVGGG